MKFQYSEKKVKLPGNVHAYAEKKVMKLARFFDEDAEALVVFSVEKNRNIAEITVHGAGTWFRAKESTSDMFASIDAAVGTIEGQIRKNKTRLARRLKQDAFGETYVHPALDTDEMKSITGTWQRRYWEYLVMKDPETHAAFKTHGVHLISYRDLVELRKKK